MGIAFRASSAAGAASPGLATSYPLTLPSAIQAGDVVIVGVEALTELSVQTPIVLSGAGLTWQPAGTPQPTANHGGFQENAACFEAVANAATAGAVVTASAQNGTDTAFWALGTVSYSGASPSQPVDVAPAGFATTTTTSIACPSASTVTAGDTAVYILCLTTESGNPTDPAGTTSRLAFLGGTDVGVYVADSNGSVGGSGTSIGGGSFGAPGNGTWWATFTVALRPAAAFDPFYISTDSNGVQTWGVVDTGNQPYTYPTGSPTCTGLRILPPSAPAAGYAHGFICGLPVNAGFDDSANGNGLDVIRTLGAQNTYNCTIVEPSFGFTPWYANHPTDLTFQQESFMVSLQQWIAASQFATTGHERHYLIGFSKGGLGGMGLLFKHAALWYAGGFWDAPFGMTAYDGTDPDYPGSPVGGNSANNYGTDASFQTNYRLSSANVNSWNTAAGNEFTSSRRIWIGGYYAFQGDVSAYQSLLTSLGILYDGSWNTLDASHAWHSGWVAAALASIIHPSASGLLTVLGIV